MMNTSSGRGRRLAFVLLSAMSLAAARLALPATDMVGAARAFLDSLPPESLAKAKLAFDDAARTDWHYVPRTRPGITFGEMTDAQRIAARNLIRTALSPRGMLKAESIMSLDGVLRDIEKAAGGTGGSRDPLAYTLTIYGEPSDARPWGWKIEGHHLSLNFTLPGGTVVDATPAFMGANPARVPSGPKAGLRVLAAEEDLGRELVRSLDEAQQKEAVVSQQVPADILTMPGRSLDGAPATGLPFSAMTPEQQALLKRLLDEYAFNLRHELAEAEVARIHEAGLNNVRFTWTGSVEPGRPHYYRISGPTFVIEYDNTQNDANHVHTVWHDRERDFGHDALKDHLEHGHAPSK